MKYQTLICAALLTPLIALAETDTLKTFKAGDRVKASEVNANFELIKKIADDAAQAAADAGSFEGLNDVYQGVSSEDPQASSSNSRFGFSQSESMKEVARSSQSGFSALNSDGDAVIPCSEEDPNCVITEDLAEVTCDGTPHRLAGVLSSPYATASFLKVQIEGDCVESMLITRGSAFFSKPGTRASITAVGDQVALTVSYYVHFENIDINGRFTAARGSMLILHKDVKIVKDPLKEGNGTGDLGLYALEGAFVKMGRNVTIEGSANISNNATLNLYSDGISISSMLIVNGGTVNANTEYVAGVGVFLASLTTQSLNVSNGGKASFRNGSFNIGFINVATNSTFVMDSFPDDADITTLETGGIWITRASSFELFGLKELTLTQESTGDFLEGTITFWDNSNGQIAFYNNESIPTIQVDSSSYLRLSPQDGAQLTVDSLKMGYGASLASNNGASTNIVVTDSLSADYNSYIQFGTVEAQSGATLDITKGCETKGVQSDLCD